MDPLTANLVTIGVAVALLGVALAVVLVRRRRPRTAAFLTPLESIVISVIGGFAMVNGALCLLRLYSDSVVILQYPSVRVDGFRYLGVTTPELLEGVAHVTESGYQSIWMNLVGLPMETRWLVYLESVLPSIGALAVSVVIAWLSFTLVRERPFARAYPIGLGVAAVAIVVGSMGTQFAGALARSSVIEFLGEEQLTADASNGPPSDVLSFFHLELDLASVGWAFGLLMVAVAFQIGTRMQKDTEALV